MKAIVLPAALAATVIVQARVEQEIDSIVPFPTVKSAAVTVAGSSSLLAVRVNRMVAPEVASAWPIAVSGALSTLATALAVLLGSLLAYIVVRRGYRMLSPALGAVAMASALVTCDSASVVERSASSISRVASFPCRS